jgi:hypothetical protein
MSSPVHYSPIISSFLAMYSELMTASLYKPYLTMKSIIFWDMMPCSPLSFNRRFGGTYRKQLAIFLLAGFAETISSTLKMEAICFSETSVETQRTTRRHVPEDDTLYNHHCEDVKSYILNKLDFGNFRCTLNLVEHNPSISKIPPSKDR